jgi:segregation and condensation protein B
VNLVQLAKASNLTKVTAEQIIAELNEEYANTGRCFRIESIAGGYRMYTLPEFHSYINQINIIERSQRLSPAALEALAVIAYKQPITKVEIERIRGVDSGGVLKNLMSKNLIIIDGRSPAPGKPLLYRTSEYFLEFFGLASLDHLPPLAEIEDQGESLPHLKLIKSGEDNEDGDYSEEETDYTEAMGFSGEGDTVTDEQTEDDSAESTMDHEPAIDAVEDANTEDSGADETDYADEIDEPALETLENSTRDN